MRILFAFAALPLLACTVTFTYTKLSDPPHALSPRRAQDVQIVEGQPTERAYVEVGLIEARRSTFGGGGEMSPRHVDLFRAKAAELGCDVIVFHGKQPVNAAAPSEKRDRAACLVYR